MINGRLIACFIGLLCFLIAFESRAQSPYFRVCVDEQDTSPLLAASPNLQSSSNSLIDLMSHAAQDLNLTLQVVRYPWQRCIAKFKSGDMDAIVGLVWQKEYEQWAVFPMQASLPDENYRLWHANYSIYVAKDSDIQWDGVNFIGLNSGASVSPGHFIEKSLKQLQAFTSKFYPPADGLRLVSLKHLEAYVVETALARALIKQHGLEHELKELNVPFVDTNWYVPVSEKWAANNPELVQQFWQALRQERIKHAPNLLARYSQISKSSSIGAR